MTTPRGTLSPDLRPPERRHSGSLGKVDRAIARVIDEWVGRELRQLSSEGAGLSVLDAGCGNQPFRRLIEELGHGYIGMDLMQNDDET